MGAFDNDYKSWSSTYMGEFLKRQQKLEENVRLNFESLSGPGEKKRWFEQFVTQLKLACCQPAMIAKWAREIPDAKSVEDLSSERPLPSLSIKIWAALMKTAATSIKNKVYLQNRTRRAED